MQFRYETNAMQAATALAERLLTELNAGKRVTWFLSGGSNIPLSVKIMHDIPDDKSRNLTVLLADERFGVPGHPDSNWQQLIEAGFDPKNAQIIPALQTEKTFDVTCADFEAAVRGIVKQTHQAGGIVVAQCGIGGDGHIAGILPNSEALTDAHWIAGYDGGAYNRITITPPVFEHIDVAYAFAYGITKRGTLQQLKNHTLPINDQPAQLLRKVPEAYVYTDQHL